MRRKDRAMGKEFGINVIDKSRYGILSLVDDSNRAYSIPISFFRIDNFLYFHSAKAGKKIDILNKNPKCSCVFVGDTNIVEEFFTTEYESAIVDSKAEEVLIDEEKIEILRELCLKYTPNNMHNFDDAIRRSLNRTSIWKIEINKISAKRKKYDDDMKEMKFGRLK